MKHAPFLLQAFASRVLATKPYAMVAKADLNTQGYDVETLCDMIEAYMLVPEVERGFVVRMTKEQILIERKPQGPAPASPQTSISSSASPFPTPGSKPPVVKSTPPGKPVTPLKTMSPVKTAAKGTPGKWATLASTRVLPVVPLKGRK